MKLITVILYLLVYPVHILGFLAGLIVKSFIEGYCYFYRIEKEINEYLEKTK